MTGWRKRQVVDMALEAGLAFDSEEFPEIWQTYMHVGREEIERFAELVCADEAERIKQANAPEIERINSHIKSLEDAVKAEAEKYKYDIHSCGPTCTKVGCVAVRKAVEAEREACAKLCAELVPDVSRTANDASVWDVATFDCAEAIRARGQA